ERADDRPGHRLLCLLAVSGDRSGGLGGPGRDGPVHVAAVAGGAAAEADPLRPGRRLAARGVDAPAELRLPVRHAIACLFHQQRHAMACPTIRAGTPQMELAQVVEWSREA